MKVKIPDNANMEGVIDLSKGKEYDILESRIPYGGYIIADDGKARYICVSESSHINGCHWEVVEDDE